MVEEEKLALDVYSVLNVKWSAQTTTFGNIINSETKHQSQVRALLTSYGITDPTTGLGQGQFATETFQGLYANLSARGLVSLKEALEVGKSIEEMDIEDIAPLITETDEAAIQQLYNQLLANSKNHLAGFQKALDALPADAATTSGAAGSETPVATTTATVTATTETSAATTAQAQSTSTSTQTSSKPNSARGLTRSGLAMVVAMIVAALV